MVRNMFGLSEREHLSSSRRRRRSVIPDGLLDVLAQNDEKTGGRVLFPHHSNSILLLLFPWYLLIAEYGLRKATIMIFQMGSL